MLSNSFTWGFNFLLLTYKYTQFSILSGVVLQSIIFTDKVLSGKLHGRVVHRTQKGQVAVGIT